MMQIGEPPLEEMSISTMVLTDASTHRPKNAEKIFNNIEKRRSGGGILKKENLTDKRSL